MLLHVVWLQQLCLRVANWLDWWCLRLGRASESIGIATASAASKLRSTPTLRGLLGTQPEVRSSKPQPRVSSAAVAERAVDEDADDFVATTCHPENHPKRASADLRCSRLQLACRCGHNDVRSQLGSDVVDTVDPIDGGSDPRLRLPRFDRRYRLPLSIAVIDCRSMFRAAGSFRTVSLNRTNLAT